MRTRYAQVAQHLASEIAAGTYPIGSTLPNEPALAESLGVSRSTLRTALGELQRLGIVSRRPSLGTRVESVQPQTGDRSFSQTLGSIEAIIQYASDTLRDGLTMEDWIADKVAGVRFGIEPGSRWLRISYRRIARSDPQAAPICWTDVYVGEAYANAVLDRMTSHSGAVSELVEEVAGRSVASVEQSLRACGLPASIAERLHAEVDAHALEIVRRYMLGMDELALFSVSLHPGDRFSYVSKLTRVE